MYGRSRAEAIERPIRRLVVASGHARSLTNFRGPLIQALCQHGVEVHAVAPDLEPNQPVVRELESLGVTVHEIPLARTGLSMREDLRALFALYTLFREVQPDAVFCYNIKPVIYGGLAAVVARVPKRFSLVTGLGYAFTGEARGRRWVVQKSARFLYSLALRRATKVFFQNPDDEALFRELGLLPDAVPSCVVNGSGVDVRYFQASPPRCDVPFTFLMLARLLGDKGVREYAEAASRVRARHPDVRFRLAGDLDSNPDAVSQAELDEWVRLGEIEYLGRIPDVRPELERASVYVLPSYREGTPRTVLEAMAMGRAVITTDAPGCRETVVDGDSGILVPVRDVDALVAAMERCLADPDLVASMGRRARQRAEDKYDVSKVNEVMLREMGIAE